jgi:hypothetical protein
MQNCAPDLSFASPGVDLPSQQLFQNVLRHFESTPAIHKYFRQERIRGQIHPNPLSVVFEDSVVPRIGKNCPVFRRNSTSLLFLYLVYALNITPKKFKISAPAANYHINQRRRGRRVAQVPGEVSTTQLYLDKRVFASGLPAAVIPEPAPIPPAPTVRNNLKLIRNKPQ